jgi:uncharacterized protein
MKEVLCDTSYFVAILDPRDSKHQLALELTETLTGAQFITCHDVFVELLNFFSGYGPHLRGIAIRFTQVLEERPDFLVVTQSEELFIKSIQLYAQRSDKSYSFTDCISMCIAGERGIRRILTTDEHFKQAGFEILLR